MYHCSDCHPGKHPIQLISHTPAQKLLNYGTPCLTPETSNQCPLHDTTLHEIWGSHEDGLLDCNTEWTSGHQCFCGICCFHLQGGGQYVRMSVVKCIFKLDIVTSMLNKTRSLVQDVYEQYNIKTEHFQKWSPRLVAIINHVLQAPWYIYF